MAKVGMISLGCPKNQVDAELMLAKLQSAGHEIKSEVYDCDAVIINTCGFIEDAKREAIDNILEMIDSKEAGEIKKIIVTGCLAERYREEILAEMPEIDAVVGIGNNGNIADILEQTLESETPVIAIGEKEALPLCGQRLLTTPEYWAYLKVADGCSNRCTYCAIPGIRGPQRSRPLEECVEEARALAADGVKELIIIAQDTTRYGEDLYGKPSLDRLLTELCRIDGLRWLRVLYCYPDSITDELIEVMAREPKVLHYIDLPLQHCNSAILKRMHRRGDRESLTALLHKIKEKMPDVIFRSTFITGFPGETEEQFEELAEFAEAIHFQRLGCFPYSQEENTPAAKMPDQVDDEIKQRRADIIMAHQQNVMAEYCESLSGTEVEVLVEGFDRLIGCWFGRTYADAPEVDGCVFFTAESKRPSPGDFVTVKITDTMGIDPVGELV